MFHVNARMCPKRVFKRTDESSMKEEELYVDTLRIMYFIAEKQ